jgi:predicted enzyme related to lactoylglutathione lyase
MSRVAHFDIVVRDIDRAKQFYSDVFGWKFDKWDGPMDYWLITTGDQSKPGINGGMSVGEPNLTGGQLTVDVESVDAVADLARSNGGAVVREKHAVQGVGYMVEIADPGGNAFGAMEEDDSAR